MMNRWSQINPTKTIKRLSAKLMRLLKRNNLVKNLVRINNRLILKFLKNSNRNGRIQIKFKRSWSLKTKWSRSVIFKMSKMSKMGRMVRMGRMVL